MGDKNNRKQIIDQIVEARKDEKRKLTTKEAAEFLRVTPRALTKWRQEMTGPTYIKVGVKKVFYYKSDLEKFERRIER
ncbi:helix-turn-helix transcriptional regulator [Desulforegula conservatrix]|uniref:helix-turn-helix transcriptional regulator n=1 Tax=Desulforegula conservatrix TaxID=153026 RepID=UPI00042367D5|nr:helix-turn-helix domain-containing protein [Desulforegula conservatrix]